MSAALDAEKWPDGEGLEGKAELGLSMGKAFVPFNLGVVRYFSKGKSSSFQN